MRKYFDPEVWILGLGVCIIPIDVNLVYISVSLKGKVMCVVGTYVRPNEAPKTL